MSRHVPSHTPHRLGSLIVLLGVLILLSVALPASQAGAATVREASLTLTSDDGDPLGNGQTYSYATSAGDAFGSSTTGRIVNARVFAANGDWWFLDFAAPEGQTLAVGTYDAATRYPFQDPSAPGLDVNGNGVGCNTLTGSFTVTQVTFDAAGAVETFDVDFEHHCYGEEPALRGHLHLVNEPVAAPLTIGLGLAVGGSVDRASGTATVGGTITCSSPVTVYIAGTLTQRATRFAQATGSFSQQVECSGTTSWRAKVTSQNSVPFGPGQAQLSTDASAYDAEHGQHATDSESATVKLAR